MERYNKLTKTRAYSRFKIMLRQEQKANGEYMRQSAEEDLPPAECGALPEPGTGAGRRPLPAVA